MPPPSWKRFGRSRTPVEVKQQRSPTPPWSRRRRPQDPSRQTRSCSRSRAYDRTEHLEVRPVRSRTRQGIWWMPKESPSPSHRSRSSRRDDARYDDKDSRDYSYDDCSEGYSASSYDDASERQDCHEEDDYGKQSFWVKHSECSKIIGKRGKTLKSIERKSGATVTVQYENEMNLATKERYIQIMGSEQQRGSALKLLLDEVHYCRTREGDVLKDDRASLDAQNPAGPTVVEVLVGEVGRVIGKNGDTIKKLERESGAKLEVDKGTGKVELFGPPEAQKHCLKMLLSEVHIEFVKDSTGRILKDTRHLKVLPLTRRNFKDEDLPVPAKVNEIEELKLLVRDRDAGKIIGHGGEVVRLIVEKTGAKVKLKKDDRVEPKEGEEPDREAPRQISIIGTPDQREHAKELILEIISWCSDIDGNILKEPKEPPKKGSGKGDTKKTELPDALAPSQDQKDEKKDNRKRSRRVALWVCDQCGGDHKSKDCPGQVWKNAVQMGMEWAWKNAAALQGGAVHPMMQSMMGGSMMGGYMNPSMGMNSQRPLMPGTPGMPSLPGMQQMPRSVPPDLQQMQKIKPSSSPAIAAPSEVSSAEMQSRLDMLVKSRPIRDSKSSAERRVGDDSKPHTRRTRHHGKRRTQAGR